MNSSVSLNPKHDQTFNNPIVVGFDTSSRIKITGPSDIDESNHDRILNYCPTLFGTQYSSVLSKYYNYPTWR